MVMTENMLIVTCVLTVLAGLGITMAVAALLSRNWKSALLERDVELQQKL
ncbi:hypothetical protein QBC35DRAFT_448836 [Podospora australis]|uniref:Uncharacterized protein n=1 Tax=Podospora australis TaxID=1536484 RepID=A0AAN6WYT7_9PEZI|nr:hypothetical protein QBC35DRAFT_448836 [Podospora australis]